MTDDIIDIQLAVLTNGRVTTDKVGPHQDLLTTRMYLEELLIRPANCVLLLFDEQEKIALIIIGTRGRSGFKRLLLGSVAYTSVNMLGI